MQKLKNLSIVLFAFAFSLTFYVACGGETPQGEGKTEVVNDGGTVKDGGTPEKPVADTPSPKDEMVKDEPAKDEAPKEQPPSGPITFTFDPADGATIDVDKFCVKITFSRSPSQRERKAEMKAEGSTVAVATGFTFKEDNIAQVCAYSLLRQGTKYTLKVTVKENVPAGQKAKTFTQTVTYTTKETYKKDKPADAGLSVNLRIESIDAPTGIGDLISGLDPNQIPPILLTLHSRDQGDSGNITLVGGLGTTPAGVTPHTGKDIIDTKKNPVSLALIGKFTGRAFYVGPTTFVLSVAGYNLQIQNFSLTGLFSKDGKNIEKANLTGILDPEVIKQQLSFDVCLLLRDECFKDKDGKDRILIAGTVKGIPNPIGFAAFVTAPLYLQDDFDPKEKFEFYTTEDITDKDFTVKLATCKGSSDDKKPCDTSKGAKITPVQDNGKVTVDSSKKHGFYTPEKLEATTWYQLSFEAKNASGKVFKSMVTFKTK